MQTAALSMVNKALLMHGVPMKVPGNSVTLQAVTTALHLATAMEL
jgi:hypothetical protein